MYLAQLEIKLANCEPKERWKSVPYPPFAILVDDDSHCKKFRSKVKAFSKHVIISQNKLKLVKKKILQVKEKNLKKIKKWKELQKRCRQAQKEAARLCIEHKKSQSKKLRKNRL